MKFNQSGVALITVMLILALATVTAVSMASRQNIDIHRSANVFNYEQAYQYTLGAEDFSKRKLVRHFADGQVIVTTDDIETWTVSFPIEGGSISGEIKDLQALFNINSLVNSTDNTPNQLQMARFRNLLSSLAPNVPPNIVEAIVDWIDQRQFPLEPNGLEDEGYSDYRTADLPMADVSELLLINGINNDIYQAILPYVCALNVVDTGININTVSAEVISSLSNNIDLEQAKTLTTSRAENSFANVNNFLRDPIFSGLNILPAGLSNTSSFFRLTTLAQIGKTNLKFISILHRNAAGEINVIKRSRSIL